MQKAWIAIPFVLAAGGAQGGCAVAAVGAVAQASVIGLQDRTLGRAIDDANASNLAKGKMLAVNRAIYSKVDVEVAQGKMLLSGRVPNEQDRLEAERIAWTVQGVDTVSNQIQVGQATGWGHSALDEWITARVRANMIAASAVKGVNYNIETHDGVVYLMGLARSEEEMRRTAEIASRVGGVKKVMSYITVRTPHYAGAQPAPTGAPIQMAGGGR